MLRGSLIVWAATTLVVEEVAVGLHHRAQALAPEGLPPVGGVADGVGAALEVVEPALDALQAAPRGRVHPRVHAEGHHHHERHQHRAPAAVPPAHVASSAGFFHVLTRLGVLRLLHVTCPFPGRGTLRAHYQHAPLARAS
jgi:hypothetical protein